MPLAFSRSAHERIGVLPTSPVGKLLSSFDMQRTLLRPSGIALREDEGREEGGVGGEMLDRKSVV